MSETGRKTYTYDGNKAGCSVEHGYLYDFT